MTDERMRRETKPDKTRERTGKYGGDDGALEHEREETGPGEAAGIAGAPAQAEQGETPADQAEQQQRRDLATGAENPG